jgi:hypothetical protein
MKTMSATRRRDETNGGTLRCRKAYVLGELSSGSPLSSSSAASAAANGLPGELGGSEVVPGSSSVSDSLGVGTATGSAAVTPLGFGTELSAARTIASTAS